MSTALPREETTVLWQDPENPRNWLGFTNGVLTASYDGIQTMDYARKTWINMVSEAVGYEEIAVTAKPDAKPFHYSNVKEALEEIVGVKLNGASVRYGFDGFYHLGFIRPFRRHGVDQSDQMWVAQRMADLLSEYDVIADTRVVITTGQIETIIYLDKDKHNARR